ncbi:MAG: YdcF family protein [Clostridia bacterium]|nr:YdcF family protein [Clostridia bacterium]
MTLVLICVLVGIIAYLGVVGMLVWKVNTLPPAENYDAIVVLGAQVKPDGSLSLQLTWRLDAAYEAWQKENCLIVVCGAQGANEPEPEAHAMRDYLVAKGVPEESILMDDASYNTRQNIRHAAELLKGRQAQRVLIVTSDYHLPRAMALAEDEGLDATGVGARTLPQYWLKNYGREGLSWIKYWMQKYLHLPLE